MIEDFPGIDYDKEPILQLLLKINQNHSYFNLKEFFDTGGDVIDLTKASENQAILTYIHTPRTRRKVKKLMMLKLITLDGDIVEVNRILPKTTTEIDSNPRNIRVFLHNILNAEGHILKQWLEELKIQTTRGSCDENSQHAFIDIPLAFKDHARWLIAEGSNLYFNGQQVFFSLFPNCQCEFCTPLENSLKWYRIMMIDYQRNLKVADFRELSEPQNLDPPPKNLSTTKELPDDEKSAKKKNKKEDPYKVRVPIPNEKNLEVCKEGTKMVTPYRNQQGKFLLFMDCTRKVSREELKKWFETKAKLKDVRTAISSDCAVLEFYTWEDMVACTEAVNKREILRTNNKNKPRVYGKSDCKCLVCRANTQEQVERAELHKLTGKAEKGNRQAINMLKKIKK